MSDSFIESEIAKYYEDKSVFITGATGFLGKVLIEKILRSCPRIKRLYVLIRVKRGKLPRERLNELFGCELFDKLHDTNTQFVDKVIPINGDILEANLGLSHEDENILVKHTNIIIHSAATVRFDEPLKLAYEMNVNGVRKMLDLAKKMTNLESFVHVSTAYANCDRGFISEVVYDPLIKENLLQESLDWLDDELVAKLTPHIIKSKPNTYTFTKAIAENVIIKHENELPLTIVRPSIIVASAEEPFKGWIDNLNGVTGIILATGKGLLRTMLCKSDAIADMIPVDYTCNLIITSSWLRGSKRTDRCLIYNFTSGQMNPLTWGMFERYAALAYYKYPFENPVLFPRPVITQSRIIAFLKQIFEQKLVAHLLDFGLKVTKRQPFLVKVNKKIDKHIGVIAFFATKQWEFTNSNSIMLMNKLNSIDTKIFNFDVRRIDWLVFIEHYCRGAKRFLLKEDLSNVSKARNDLKRMRLLTFAVKLTFLTIVIKLCLFRKVSITDLLTFLFKILISISKSVKFIQVMQIKFK